MSHNLQFYIDGQWVAPTALKIANVIDPSSEDAFAEIALGSKADVDKAVAAAKRAFQTYGFASRAERLDLLRRIVEIYKRRREDLALAVSREMGAPRPFALSNQVSIGLAHLEKMVETLETFEFEHAKNGALVVKEPIGVVGLITPWNWPLNQITCKVGPGFGCGLHDGVEAERDRAARRAHFRRNPRGSGRAEGRVQPRQRRRADGRAGDRQPSRRRHGVVHRLDPRRHPGRQGGRRHRQARASGTRRQVGQHPLPRRRFRRPRSRKGVQGVLWQQRPVVQRADPHVRAARAAGGGRRLRQGGRRNVRASAPPTRPEPSSGRSSTARNSTRSRP